MTMMKCVNVITTFFIFMINSDYGQAYDKSIFIKISYDEVHDRILPFIETTTTKVDKEITINSNKKISSREERSSGKHAFGQSSKYLILGPGELEEWRVAGKDKLVNIEDYTSYRRAILLTVREGSCTAEVDYELKPGFSDYRYHRLKTGEAAVARSVEAYNLRCSVQ